MSCLQPLSKLLLVEGSLPQKLLFFGSGTALGIFHILSDFYASHIQKGKLSAPLYR